MRVTPGSSGVQPYSRSAMAQGRVWPCLRRAVTVLLGSLVLSGAAPVLAGDAVLRYFPSGLIYEYRWKLLELALAHLEGEAPYRLQPLTEEVTQNRAVLLLQSGGVDVIALGTTEERESGMLPVKIDILRGIVGYRLLVIRRQDQARFSKTDEAGLRRDMVFGLNSQWADLPVMRANGFAVETSAGYDNLFSMLAAHRFDAFPRGLNEARRELEQQHQNFPQLSVERSKALYIPYPVYFWVNKRNTVLASQIERGLKLALADGSFRRLFERYHAQEIESLKAEKRQVIRLTNPLLPPGNDAPDTSWWWRP